MSKIFVWGIGERLKYFMLMEYLNQKDILAYIVSNKECEEYMSKPVYDINDLVKHQDDVDYIVIANEFYQEILQLCHDNNIDMNKIILTDNIPLEPYRKYYKRVEKVSKKLFHFLEKQPFILTKSNEIDLVDKNMLVGTGKYNRLLYMQDYFRYRTFELVANDIREKNIPGAVAELGVFKGHFASLINEHFSDRNIYLFDTFEGFDETEANEELERRRCDEDFIKGHKDTSVQLMLKNLPHPDKAIVCKGFFPHSVSVQASGEKYAFVSLDVDFEESMYQGLKFFYPRMAKQGVIFVHDYNTYYLEGVRDAIKRYEDDENIVLCKVPIADRAGTLIITKP